jgi:hypothetical protein
VLKHGCAPRVSSFGIPFYQICAAFLPHVWFLSVALLMPLVVAAQVERAGVAPSRLGPWDPHQQATGPTPAHGRGKAASAAGAAAPGKCSSAMLGGLAAGAVVALAALAALLQSSS